MVHMVKQLVLVYNMVIRFQVPRSHHSFRDLETNEQHRTGFAVSCDRLRPFLTGPSERVLERS